MRVLLTQQERLLFFVSVPKFWDFRFQPSTLGAEDNPLLDHELHFVEPLYNRVCAIGYVANIEHMRDVEKCWRVHMRDVVDKRDPRAAALEDGRLKLLAIGARLQGISPKYSEKEVLVFMLHLAATVARSSDRALVTKFLNDNPVPAAIRSRGYRTIVDDLFRAMEVN